MVNSCMSLIEHPKFKVYSPSENFNVTHAMFQTFTFIKESLNLRTIIT